MSLSSMQRSIFFIGRYLRQNQSDISFRLRVRNDQRAEETDGCAQGKHSKAGRRTFPQGYTETCRFETRPPIFFTTRLLKKKKLI